MGDNVFRSVVVGVWAIWLLAFWGLYVVTLIILRLMHCGSVVGFLSFV